MATVDRQRRSGLWHHVPADSPFARHFPTFHLLWNCLVFTGTWLWRRRRILANSAVVAALALVPLYGCQEFVIGPQRDAVAAITNAGGTVCYNWQFGNGRRLLARTQPPVPRWAVEVLGRDWFGHVVVVSLEGVDAGDTLMMHVGRLTRIKRLDLLSARITHAGLAQIENSAISRTSHFRHSP